MKKMNFRPSQTRDLPPSRSRSGSGQYFVLGDNRNNSEDSRHNGMGLVDSDRIVGKLWFTISPWKKIGFV